MRIWIINQYAIPPTRAGGTWHYLMARELGQRGHEVTIIAGSLDHGSGEQYGISKKQAWKKEIVEDVEFLWLRTPAHKGNSPGRAWNMLVFAMRVYRGTGLNQLHKPDIIIGTIPTPFAAFAACRLARSLGVPFLLDIRDLWPGQMADVGRQTSRMVGRITAFPPVMKVLRALEAYLYRRAFWVLTVIPRAAEYIATRGTEREKVTWVPQVVDFCAVPAVSTPKASVPFTLIYAGTFSAAYNLDSVITAAAILQKSSAQVHFRLIGSGPEKERLENRVLTEDLLSVSIEPAVPKSRIYETLQNADAFIAPALPSSMHRYGLAFQKTIDYMALARPTIIVTDEVANPITESHAGLRVRPGDPEALVEAILELINTPLCERIAMGLRGRAVAEGVHDATKVAEKLESVLLRVDKSFRTEVLTHMGTFERSK